MKTNIDEPCAGNLQARFFRGSCSNKTQTRGVKLQLLPNRFSKEKREAFNKSFYELLKNSFKNINEKDEKGETILHKAARMSTREKVSFLVRKGADVNARDNKGFTPLHWAVSAKRLENVKVLMEEGAEVNATEGITPLHLACMVWAERIIKELVKGGAAVNQPDKFGNAPMYWLMANEKNKRVKKFLEKQGGIVRDRPEICDEVVESVGEMVDVWSRKFLPKLKGKVVSLEEIRKRDKSLIIEDFNKVISRVVGKMNTMIKELDER